MTHLEQAITDAIEKGGYSHGDICAGFKIELRKTDTGYYVVCESSSTWANYALEVLLLDPAFWIALGRARGWGDKACMECGFNGRFDDYHRDCGECLGKEYSGALYQQHRLIDHLAAGKDIESFFATL